MASRPIFPGTIKTVAIELDSGDTTTAKSLVTAGTHGARVDRVSVTTDDSVDVVLDVFYYDTATDFLLGSITIPAGSGTDGGTTAVISLLNLTTFPFLGDDLAIYLEGGHSLRVAAQATMTAAKVCHLVAQYGDY